MARWPRIWARVVNALEEQERIDDLLKIEHEFINRYGDCLASKAARDGNCSSVRPPTCE